MLRRLAITVLLLGTTIPGVTTQTREPMFVFQSNFWVNLHQFLRGEVYRRGAGRPLGIDPASLSAAERAAWSSALGVYFDVAKRDLVFDEGAQRIANALATTADTATLADGLLDARTTQALNAASPIYRERLWPARHRDNAAWAESAKALVERHRAAMTAALAKIYGIAWPQQPYLVDVVGEVGPNSAVTHEGPPGFAAHTQASAGSARNTGDAPLELLFHEASHTEAIGEHIVRLIGDESARQKVTAPRELWHYVIMFTTGEVARRELASTGSPGYVPYAERYDQIPSVERAALERAWRPYLNGAVSLEQALRDLVSGARQQVGGK